jgi:hypothetical protein
MRNLSELKINDGGKPVRRRAPTNDDVEAFQARFRVTLPDEYLFLLRHSNGGHPELDTVFPIGQPENVWSVNEFYHLDDDKSAPSSLWLAMERWRTILGGNALPFAADGGGNQFFLDLGISPPAVKVCIHDESFLVVDLAPSLDAFIDALYIDPDMI